MWETAGKCCHSVWDQILVSAFDSICLGKLYNLTVSFFLSLLNKNIDHHNNTIYVIGFLPFGRRGLSEIINRKHFA